MGGKDHHRLVPAKDGANQENLKPSLKPNQDPKSRKGIGLRPRPKYNPEPGQDPRAKYNTEPGQDPRAKYNPEPGQDPRAKYNPEPGQDPRPGSFPQPKQKQVTLQDRKSESDSSVKTGSRSCSESGAKQLKAVTRPKPVRLQDPGLGSQTLPGHKSNLQNLEYGNESKLEQRPGLERDNVKDNALSQVVFKRDQGPGPGLGPGPEQEQGPGQEPDLEAGPDYQGRVRRSLENLSLPSWYTEHRQRGRASWRRETSLQVEQVLSNDLLW